MKNSEELGIQLATLEGNKRPYLENSELLDGEEYPSKTTNYDSKPVNELQSRQKNRSSSNYEIYVNREKLTFEGLGSENGTVQELTH